MTNSKTYLNVPYAQKDAAKSLGARWDPVNKKWYVPAGKDISPFAQWHIDNETVPTKSNIAPKASGISNTETQGVFTYPSIDNFVPYQGDQPPWD